MSRGRRTEWWLRQTPEHQLDAVTLNARGARQRRIDREHLSKEMKKLLRRREWKARLALVGIRKRHGLPTDKATIEAQMSRTDREP